jgi:hypothetical protein
VTEIAYSNEDRFTEPQVVGTWPIVWALGLGFVWALLAVFLGYRLGWLALPIGLALGRYTQKFQLVPSSRGAWLALRLTVLALVVFRVSSSVGGSWYVSTHEIRVDQGLVYEAVLADVSAKSSGATDQPLSERKINDEVVVRMESLTNSQQRSIVREYIHAANVRVVRPRSPHGWFRLWDVIWCGLALRIAYRLGGVEFGLGEEVLVDSPHGVMR